MMKGSRNAKNYVDVSWGMFVEKLLWKAERNGCAVVKVSKRFPSSQLCNVCGYKHKDVAVKHLENWVCPECGVTHQRDFNAALNIKREGLNTFLWEAQNRGEKGNDFACQIDTCSVSLGESLAKLALI